MEVEDVQAINTKTDGDACMGEPSNACNTWQSKNSKPMTINVNTYNRVKESTVVNLTSKNRVTFSGTRSTTYLHFVIQHNKQQEENCMRNMHLTFQAYFKVKEMNLVIL